MAASDIPISIKELFEREREEEEGNERVDVHVALPSRCPQLLFRNCLGGWCVAAAAGRDLAAQPPREGWPRARWAEPGGRNTGRTANRAGHERLVFEARVSYIDAVLILGVEISTAAIRPWGNPP